MKAELCKLFRGKLVFALMILALVANAGLLFIQKDKIRILQVIDDFSASNGSPVSEEKLAILKKAWEEEVGHQVSWEEYEDNIERAAHYYESVQIDEIAESYCNLMHLEGKAAEYVRTEFLKLEGQFQNAGEQIITFFAPYRMYIFDFITTYLLFALNLEGISIAVIVTLYCIERERSNRTVTTIYSTSKGKNILYDKLLASVMASLICFGLLVIMTLLLASCMFPVNTIMDTLVSNPMVTLKGTPCISNVSMTIGGYIFKSLGMTCILAVIYSIGSFSIGIRAKNCYYAFGMVLVLLSVMKTFSSMAPTSTNLFFWTQYNPLDMALKAGTWFLYNAGNFSPLGYEIYTVMIWLLICSGGCFWGFARLTKMKKQGKEWIK